MTIYKKIHQLMPAQGYYAAFDVDGKRELTPIACWAIVQDEETGTYFIDGFIAKDIVDCPESSTNFMYYMHESEDIPYEPDLDIDPR